jgi:altronate hydrolase
MTVLARAFPALLLGTSDNVAVMLDNAKPGTPVQPGLDAAQRIPKGHKVATVAIDEGEPVRKFGQIIGFATRRIEPGEWVHEHNCGIGAEGGAFARDYDFGAAVEPVAFVPEERRSSFDGFRRSNGKVGTRNYIGILTSVNCSATVARYIVEAVQKSGMLDDYPTIDGIVSFVHATGCGMAGKGEGFEVLSRTQWGYAANPNLGAALMVGLGCEVFQIGRMKQIYGIAEDDTFQTLTIQGEGGTRKAIEQGVERVRAMLPIAARARREPVPRIRTRARAAMRRIGRLFRHHPPIRRSASRSICWSAKAAQRSFRKPRKSMARSIC